MAVFVFFVRSQSFIYFEHFHNGKVMEKLLLANEKVECT